MRRQQPYQRRIHPQQQRKIPRIHEVAAQALRPRGDGQVGNAIVPVDPEIVECLGPHLGRHAQRRRIHGGLPEQLLLPLEGDLAEDGAVHDEERHEERSRRPLVQLRVVGEIALALDG